MLYLTDISKIKVLKFVLMRGTLDFEYLTL